MKEILYIQAGQLSNYSGTHFWNTQESYVTTDEKTDVDPKISFCEREDEQGRSTLCPRVVMFDVKSQFGALTNTTSLNELENRRSIQQKTWTGAVVKHTQDPIQKSEYHVQLEKEAGDQGSKQSPESHQGHGQIRYWTDFSRVYFLPKSCQGLPDTSWRKTQFDWFADQQEFSVFDEETEFMDGTFRSFVEDCDNLQGLQLQNDTLTFGGFISAFLARFRDEYIKLPSFTFPTISPLTQSNTFTENVLRRRQILNEAQYLCTLNQFSSMNIPVEHPSSWLDEVWRDLPHFPRQSLYHQSAVLSSYIESSTLPFRLSHVQEDIASICSQLKCRTSTPFGELSGFFSANAEFNLEDGFTNLSYRVNKPPNEFSRIDVLRGVSSAQVAIYDYWSSKRLSPLGPYVRSIYGPAYPLPTSFPSIVPPGGSGQSNLNSTTTVACLSTSCNTVQALEGYAAFVDQCVKSPRSLLSDGFSMDDLKELSNDLWGIHDNAAGGSLSDI